MLDNLVVHPEFEPVAVWDPSEEAQAKTRAEFPAVPQVGSAEAAIAAADAVYLACPPAPRKAYALSSSASEQGKGVFLEKPLGVDIEESRDLVAKLAAAGTRSAVNFTQAAGRALTEVKRAFDAGEMGAIKGIDENWFQGRITDSAYELERKVNEGRRIVVGVNAFTEGNEEDQIPLLRITNEDEQRQRKRLDAVRDRRDDAAVEAVLARLRSEAADPEINLMPTLIEAAHAYATLGEIMAAMGSVFGRHVEVPTF